MASALFINPSALSRIYQSLSSQHAAIEPPIWAALLANATRHRGHQVQLLDCEGEGMGYEQAAEYVLQCKPDLVIVVTYGQQPSASTQNMHGASETCKAIKQLNPEQKILLLGGHVSALPRLTLEEESVDFVCQGEGVYTIDGLLNSPMDRPDKLATVPGLWYWDDVGNICHTQPAPMIPQDQLEMVLPGMAFDLLPMQNYRAHNWHCFDDIDNRQPYASIYTSLGCPFTCSFCCINAPFEKNRFRYWSPEFMIKQFDILALDYNVKNVKIADEMFVLKDHHFMELCKLIKERNYGFNIWAYTRVDTVKPRHLALLKEAGVNWLVVGIESVDKRVRDGVIKGKFSEERIPQVVNMIRDHDINVHGNFIFGLPDDDAASLKNNLDMAIELNCEMANFYSAMAYPGSQLHQMAQTEQWTLPETWIGYSQHSVETLPLPTKHLSAGEVLAFRDKAWQAYYTNPKYLNMLSRKFGVAVADHVRSMSDHRLSRAHAHPTPRIEFKYPHFDSREFKIPTQGKQ